MKKYLMLAVVAGMASFLSVSWMAQAQNKDVSHMPNVKVGPEFIYAKDRAECELTPSYAAPKDPAVKAEALKACLAARGHAAEEIAKEEEQRAATAANAPANVAPTSTPLDTTPPAARKP